MKKIISLIVMLASLNSFAGGSRVSGDSGYNQILNFEKDLNTEVLSAKSRGQVYYMGKKQAEIEFATNKAGDDKVEIQSLRPEEISDSALIDGLKRSQQSKQWENIKLPSKIDMNRIILNNKLGGMQVR